MPPRSWGKLNLCACPPRTTAGVRFATSRTSTARPPAYQFCFELFVYTSAPAALRSTVSTFNYSMISARVLSVIKHSPGLESFGAEIARLTGLRGPSISQVARTVAGMRVMPPRRFEVELRVTRTVPKSATEVGEDALCRSAADSSSCPASECRLLRGHYFVPPVQYCSNRAHGS